jgi:hypothetical protein
MSTTETEFVFTPAIDDAIRRSAIALSNARHTLTEART